MGRAVIVSPAIITITVIRYPGKVAGYISPYPTVVIVTITNQYATNNSNSSDK